MKSEVHSVVISKKAKELLVSHSTFLTKVSPSAAKSLVKDFKKTASSLENMPNRCPWLSGENIPKHQYRYIAFGKWYILVYQIIDKIVYVEYVIDCRQDYQWLFN